jgi:prepilin peptidase CpaA
MPAEMTMGGAMESLPAEPVMLASFSLPLTVQATILLAAVGVVTWAALSDLRSNIIPNSANVALFVLWTAWVVSGAEASPGYSLAIGAAVFLFGAALFYFNQMGGGDVKLLTALGIWAGPAEILPFLLQVAVAGGVLTAAWILHGRLAAPVLGRVMPADAKRVVPYGVAIAAGAYLMFARIWM